VKIWSNFRFFALQDEVWQGKAYQRCNLFVKFLPGQWGSEGAPEFKTSVV